MHGWRSFAIPPYPAGLAAFFASHAEQLAVLALGHRVPAIFEPVIAEAVAFLGQSGASLYVYGSVANGAA